MNVLQSFLWQTINQWSTLLNTEGINMSTGLLNKEGAWSKSDRVISVLLGPYV